MVTRTMTTTTTESKTVEERLTSIEEMLTEVHGFCMRLAETLDALGQNPMLAAMVPPGTFGVTE